MVLHDAKRRICTEITVMQQVPPLVEVGVVERVLGPAVLAVGGLGCRGKTVARHAPQRC